MDLSKAWAAKQFKAAPIDRRSKFWFASQLKQRPACSKGEFDARFFLRIFSADI
jgi:hypothetical protein